MNGWERSQKSSSKSSNRKVSFLNATVALSWATADARAYISQHGQHLSGPGAAPPAQPSLGCHLLGRRLIHNPLPPRPVIPWQSISLCFHHPHQSELLLRTEHNAQNQERKLLKSVSAGIRMFGQTKGVDQCIQILPAKTKTSFQKNKLSLWRHALPFHRQPSSGRSLQESHGDPLGLQHLFLGTSLCTRATNSTQLVSWRGGITLPCQQGRETAGLIPESWDFLVDRSAAVYHPTQWTSP